MAKIKFECDVNKYINDYNEEKSAYEKARNVVSIEHFSEIYCSFVASKERIIYSILNNEDYKLLDMSVTYQKSNEEYLLKISYSCRNEVTVKKVILRKRIKTDIDDFIVSIDKSEFVLLIPYKKQNELSPDVEYYVDIAEFLDSINASKIDKASEQHRFISYMTGEEYTEEEFLKLTSEEVRKKALERKKQNL